MKTIQSMTSFLKKIFLFQTNVNQLSEYDLDSMKRSIEYRVQQEAKITRSLIATTKSTTGIETIMKEDIMIDLPKTTLEDFLHFDKQLKVDVELMKKIVRNFEPVLLHLKFFFIIYLLYNFILEMLYGASCKQYNKN